VLAPRIAVAPPAVSSLGQEACELAARAGLILDPWQRHVLDGALGLRADGRWAAFEVGLNVPRQNGKGGVLEARELVGLFLTGERLLIHSAHEFATSLEAFNRMLMLIEQTPEFDRRVKRISRAHGEEGIELFGGQRLRYRTRTKGGGRGFTGDLVILDEAMDLPSAIVAALLPTMSARSVTGNPQAWYAASAVDRTIHDHGVTFARLRERALAGEDASLAYFEYSARVGDPADDDPDRITGAQLAGPISWAQANPALGVRISEEHVANELRSMGRRTFAVERLGIGDWPPTDGDGDRVIDLDVFLALTHRNSTAEDPVTLAFDVTPDRAFGTIGVAGDRADGELVHVEIIDHRRGTAWLVDRLLDLHAKHRPRAVIADAAGPAGSLIPALEKQGLSVTTVTAREYAQACGAFFDSVDEGTISHLGTQELVEAVRGAVKRPLGDAAWAWSRARSAVDISPIVAVTLAHWGHVSQKLTVEPWAASW
jgi:phage terminase large subunit-like protein